MAVPTGVAMVVAVQHYQAGPAALATLAGAGACGFLAAPVVLHVVAALALPVARAYAGLLVVAALAWLAAGLWPSLMTLVAGAAVAQAAVSSAVPLATSWWRANSADRDRGRWFSRSIRFEATGGILGTLVVVLVMRNEAANYLLPIFMSALAIGVAALCAWRIPGGALPVKGGINPLASLAWLWRDRRFGYISLSWMIMGFANFAALPLRVSYLADPAQGLGYGAALVQILVVGIPTAIRLLVLPYWGRWFDRVDIIAMRMVINVCFAGAIACTFTSSLSLQILGSVLCGLAFGGGDLAWSLWVTRVAPPERTGAYMAAHTFLTGFRGLVAPFLSFHLAQGWGMVGIAYGAVGMIVLATVMLWPEMERK